MKKGHLFIILALTFKILFAQGEAAVPFLELQQSPLLHGAGQIGVSIPMSDPLGFYFNPAQLGYFSRENSFSILALPQKIKWLGDAFPGLTLQTFGITAGYNFRNREHGVPLSIGVGYIHNSTSYGKFIGTYGSFESYDNFDCFSMGASYEYYLLFNLGFSIKPFSSHLAPGAEVNSTAFDFGALIIAPISKLLFNNAKMKLDPNSYVKPRFDFSLGYSVLNIGKKISYIDAAQADPIPRTARFGYTFKFGLDLFTNKYKINTLDYSFTAEAEDILIKRSIDTNSFLATQEYQNFWGDINLGKHLIELRGDQNVVVHRGHIFKLFETVIITSGRFNGHGYDNRKANGFGISTEGIFKLLSTSINNSAVDFISDHFVLEYYDTNTFVDSDFETNFKGIALRLKNFGSLFN
jgi:hypothetical protein